MPTRTDTRKPSPAELQVLKLVAQGLSNRQIAKRRKVSVRTVDAQMYRAMKKTAARNRTQLVVVAATNGWLE